MALRKMISIDEDLCTGCGDCVPACDEGALAIVDGKAKLVKDIFCDGLGACLGDCPTGALKVEAREAEDFDPVAVIEHLKSQGRAVPDHMPSPESLRMDNHAESPKPVGGCPGSAVMSLTPCGQANIPTSLSKAAPVAPTTPATPPGLATSVAPTAPAGLDVAPGGFPPGMTSLDNTAGSAGSALTNWPVQLRLVPPTAPFLHEADLLLTADCVPVACPDYQKTFLTGRVVLMGCPKFDNQMEYVEKLAAIIGENDLRSITVLEMEVPCCSSMSTILAEAVKRAGKSVAITRVTIARTGNILGMVPLNF